MANKLVQAPDQDRLNALAKCEECKKVNYCWSFPDGKCFQKLNTTGEKQK